ncbi:MAG TPA: helix-turn-helix transcriptional regulator [Clostridiales bacterium]|nr:helix-turn-helix transcriptional regulator [Clostridiales bacterium]
MRISYNKLWKMLIDKNMNKRDLAEKSGVSSASIAKLSKGANITTDVLLKICETMDCHIEDILETINDQEEK